MEMDDRIAFLVTLHGKVQGIGLRKRIRAAAEALGVTGWVRNRNAGHVQAHLEGPGDAVRRLIADLQLQVIRAEITDCVISKAEPKGYPVFRVATNTDTGAITKDLIGTALTRASLLTQEFRELNQLLFDAAHHAIDDVKIGFRGLAQEIPPRYLGEPLSQKKNALGFDLADVVCSYANEAWSQTVMNRAAREPGVRPVSSVLNDKANGQIFARSIGLRVPETYQSGVELGEVEPRPGVVVKTSSGAGSRGVYAFLADGQIFHLGPKRNFGSEKEFYDDARALLNSTGRRDSWIVEEMILNDDGGIPNDLKMLSFYGNVALIQEESRMPNRYCYYDREGNRVRTGRYEDREFEGTGSLPEYVALAEEISLKLPVPFMRIDFLKAGEGPVFGEFTPKPGNFHEFDAATDCRLGRCYAEARGRLMADLMKGKTFPEYTEFLQSLKPRKTSAKPAA